MGGGGRRGGGFAGGGGRGGLIVFCLCFGVCVLVLSDFCMCKLLWSIAVMTRKSRRPRGGVGWGTQLEKQPSSSASG